MARGKTLIKQSAVERAAKGLFAAATATGVSGDIEVDLAAGVVRFHMTSAAGMPLPALTEESSGDLRKLL